MPRLQGIRLVNVRANENTIVFPDVFLAIDGKNTLVDMHNGGGKTLAMQMFFQTVLPNSYFSKKNKIFTLLNNVQPGSAMHVVSRFQVEGVQFDDLVLGFCACASPSLSEDGEEGEPGLKYMNYLITGRSLDEDELGVSTLPLSLYNQQTDKRSAKSFDEIKAFLLSKKRSPKHEKRYEIMLFENKKGAYMTELRKFGINREVFELLMEINEDENYIKAFFEDNCKTPRELLTEFIIPQTEKALAAKSYLPGEKQEDRALNLAESLFNKSKSLNELKVFQQDRANYDRLVEGLRELDHFMDSREAALESFSAHLEQYPRQYTLVNYLLLEAEIQKQQADAEDSNVYNEMNDCQRMIDNIEIRIGELRMIEAQKEYEAAKNQVDAINAEIERANHTKDRYEAVNKMIDFKSCEAELKGCEEALEKLTSSQYDEKVKLASYANTISSICDKRIKECRTSLEQERERREMTHESRDELNKKTGETEHEIKLLEADIKSCENEIDSLEEENTVLAKELSKYESYSGSLLPQEEQEKLISLIFDAEKRLAEISTGQEKLRQERSETIKASELACQKQEFLEDGKQKNDKEIAAYQKSLETAEHAAGEARDKLPEILEIFEVEIKTKNETVLNLKRQISLLKDEVEILTHFGFLRKRSAYDAVYQLRGEWQYAKFGSEWLQEIEQEDRDRLLTRFPWICEVVIVTDSDYQNLVAGKKKTTLVVEKENLIFVPRSLLESGDELRFENLFLLTPDAKYYSELLNTGLALAEREKKVKNFEAETSETNKSIGLLKERTDIIKGFIAQYPPVIVEALFRENTCLSNDLAEIIAWIRKLSNDMVKIEMSENMLSVEQITAEEQKETFELKKELVDKKIDINTRISEQERSLSDKNRSLKAARLKQKDLQLNIERETITIKRHDAEIANLEKDLDITGGHMSTVAPYVIKGLEGAENADLKVLVTQFETIRKPFEASDAQLRLLTETQDSCRRKMAEIESDHQVVQFAFDELYREAREVKYKNEAFIAINEYVHGKQNDLKNESEKMNETGAVKINAEDKYNQAVAKKGSYYGLFVDMLLDEAQQKYNELLIKKEEINKQASEKRKTVEKLAREISRLESEQGKYEAFCNARELPVKNARQAIDHISFEVLNKDFTELYKRFNKNIGEINDQISQLVVSVDKLEINNVQLKKALSERLEKIRDFKAVSSLRGVLSRSIDSVAKVIENINISIGNIGKLDEEIAQQIYRMLCSILDEAARIQEYSKFKYGSAYKEFLRINLTEEGSRYGEDEALRRLRTYVYELAGKTEGAGFGIKEIKNSLAIRKLLPYGVDLNKLSIQILKIQVEKSRYYSWGNLMASSGQGYVTYVMFAVTMIKYFNNVSQPLYKDKSPIFIFLDNPFASASAFELWEPVRQFLDRCNAQLLCAAHNPPSTAQILFDNEIIIEQFKNAEGQFVNQIRNQKIESKEMINMSLFDGLEK